MHHSLSFDPNFYQNREHYHRSRKSPLAPFRPVFISIFEKHPLFWCFHNKVVLPVLEQCICEIIQCILFLCKAFFFSLNVVFLRFTHVIVCINSSSVLVSEYCFIALIEHHMVSHFPIDKHMSCFQFGVIFNIVFSYSYTSLLVDICSPFSWIKCKCWGTG